MEETVEEAPERVEEQLAAEEAADESAGPDQERLASIIESVLFASGEPLTLRRLVEVLDGPTAAEVKRALRVVNERLEESGRGLRLTEVAGGYQLRTARENAEWVRAVFRDKPRKLGRAALETLSVIAYRQPVTRAEVEAIRGVDIDAVLSTLLQRNIVKMVGRKEAVGRPILYGTTEAFLELFGFRDLSELPTLKELPTGGEVNPDEQATATAEGGEAGDATYTGGETGDGTFAAAEASEASEASTAAEAGAPPERREAAEASESSRGHVEAEGGGADPGGPGSSEREGGEGAGDEGEPGEGSR